MKTVYFFGIYDPEYSRNRILSQGFKENGWNIAAVRADPQKHRHLLKYLELFKEWRRSKKEQVKPDVVLVAFPGHTVVWLARLLWPRSKLCFDAFLSRYDSNVMDRKSYGPFSFRGLADWFIDWSSCLMSQVILLDTNEHIKYFSRQFGVSRGKMARVPIGADPSIFYPRQAQKELSSKFIVHFHGMFIPLQGLGYITLSAELLRDEPDIFFQIIGSGQEYGEVKRLIEEKNLTNISLFGSVPLKDVPSYIERADVCLGIFGDTEKTLRVIPNKVYECIAMKKAVITADTPALREFFTNEKHVILCERKSGKSIKEAILRLKNNPALREELAENSYGLFKNTMLPGRIVSDLISRL